MAYTSNTYDSVYSYFMDITKTQNINYPNTDLKKYNLIRIGVDRYNIRLKDTLGMDNLTETFDRDLQYWQIRIIALYMKYNIIEGEKDYKNTINSVFTKEIGLRNIATQAKNSENTLQSLEDLIDEIIFNTDDTVLET